MQTEFENLLQRADLDSQDLSPGQMLLMGFNGLFTKLNTDFTSMLEAVALLAVPDVWRKVDVVKEAKSLQVSKFVKRTCV